MRMIASITLSAAMLSSTACSDLECGENELKIGKTCFPRRHGPDAATATTTGQANGSTGQANAGDIGGGSLPALDAGSGIDSGTSGLPSSVIDKDSQVPVHALDPSVSSPSAMSTQSAPPPCDGGAVNVCNGCESLTHAVGEACSNDGQGPCALTGTYQCFAEHLVCNAPKGMASAEVCDGIDNDCNGKTDEGLLNACKTCGPVPAEVCDGVDNNCDGQIDEGLLNACKKCGAVPDEICDGLDNDCDGQVDEADASGAPTWYPDCDGDGYGVLEGSVKGCAMPAATAGCKAYLRTDPPVPLKTQDCRDDSDLYNPGVKSGWSQAPAGNGPWAGQLRYDFDCDGVVEVSSKLLTSNNTLMDWCPMRGCCYTCQDDQCASTAKSTTDYCGQTSQDGYIATSTSGQCNQYTGTVTLLCH